MVQEKKRNYRKKSADYITAASAEMGNVPPQATDIEDAMLELYTERSPIDMLTVVAR